MSLNLKTDDGRQIFSKLIEKADVLLEGFRPGVVDRLGADYESVRKVNPSIIYCSITGYGQDGPFRDRVGHDVNYLSFSGILNLIGEPDRPPSIPGIQIADVAAGGMNAAIGILLALFAREKTGRGQYIDISMTDGMVGFSTADFYPLVPWKIVSGKYYVIILVFRKWPRFNMMTAAARKFWNICAPPLRKKHWMNGLMNWRIWKYAGVGFRPFRKYWMTPFSGNAKCS
jgi:hypothetical protein